MCPGDSQPGRRDLVFGVFGAKEKAQSRVLGQKCHLSMSSFLLGHFGVEAA